MIKYIVSPFLFLAPFTLLAQENIDSATKRKCDGGKYFVKVEVMPSLKDGNKVFEDSLTSYLREKRAFKNFANIELEFIVTKDSDLDAIKIIGDDENKETLKESFLHFSYMWKPATQNHYVVCSYVKLKIQIENNKLRTTVYQ